MSCTSRQTQKEIEKLKIEISSSFLFMFPPKEKAWPLTHFWMNDHARPFAAQLLGGGICSFYVVYYNTFFQLLQAFSQNIKNKYLNALFCACCGFLVTVCDHFLIPHPIKNLANKFCEKISSRISFTIIGCDFFMSSHIFLKRIS